jgi:hypothetical protein
VSEVVTMTAPTLVGDIDPKPVMKIIREEPRPQAQVARLIRAVTLIADPKQFASSLVYKLEKGAVERALQFLTDVLREMSTQPALFPEVVHKENFLSPEETAALFDACVGLLFQVTKTHYGAERQFESVMFCDEVFCRDNIRHGYRGSRFPLTGAPAPIAALAAKLTAHAGKDINYLSIVRYAYHCASSLDRLGSHTPGRTLGAGCLSAS